MAFHFRRGFDDMGMLDLVLSLKAINVVDPDSLSHFNSLAFSAADQHVPRLTRARHKVQSCSRANQPGYDQDSYDCCRPTCSRFGYVATDSFSLGLIFDEACCFCDRCLGETWAHACTNRVMLRWEGDLRVASLIKSPSQRPGKAYYGTSMIQEMTLVC